MPHTFKLSDESVNSYGFWVKTSGIDLSQFRKNPVMLYDHRRYGLMPIGKWVNIRVENNELLADAEFDKDDEEAVKIEKKVEGGYIRGASIGLKPLKMSEAKEDIKPGQTRPTAVKSLIIEASITPFPSNYNSLKLKFDGKTVSLSDGDAEINSIIPKIKTETMKEVKKMLGLSDEATEKDVVEALTALQKSNEELSAQRNDLFVKLGEAKGTVTEANRDKMKKLADTDFDLALDFANQETAKAPETQSEKKDKSDAVRLSDVLEAMRKPAAPEKTYRELADSDPKALQKLYDEDFEKFNELYRAEYGRDYKKQ